MGLAKHALKAVRAGLHRVGLDLRYTRDGAHRLNGVRLQWGEPDPLATSGYVVKACHKGRPVSFFVANEHDEIQREHRAGRFYEPEELDIIARHYRGGTFLDVGANVGNHTLFAARVLRAPRVLAVEPNPAAASVLEINLLLNRLCDRVQIFRYGLSSHTAMASVDWSPEFNLGATRLKEGAGPIRMAPGDDIIREDVGFIKIDTEGFELDVLAGLTRTLQRCRPIVFVEVEPQNDAALHRFIGTHGYGVVETFERYAGTTNYLLAPV